MEHLKAKAASSLQSLLVGKPSLRANPRGDGDPGARPPNPLSYPKSAQPLDLQLFKDPTSEYRGCPLWVWNAKLEKDLMLRQIDYLGEMGMGGFHMHVRIGLDTQYLGAEFMDIVRECVEYAESKKMMACLYDEDRWPSGSAGGTLTKQHPEYKGKHLLFTQRPYGCAGPVGDCSPSSARACRSENGHLLAAYAIKLDDQGFLAAYHQLRPSDKPPQGAAVWLAYVETNPPSPWFNSQTYVDTLSKDAMASFIEATHEVYKGKIGDKFGTAVPCIFTDEPQFATKTQLPNPHATDDVFLPWTADLADSFTREYGSDASLVAKLPELVWDLPNGKPSLARYRFHDHVCERFVSAFMDQLGGWCARNNIFLNGHMMEEPTLQSQTTALGEAMRCYRGQQLPGIDLLNDSFEYNTAKQASSVARQSGAKACMSEIYGCTHWFFTFEGHKGCGDWQAALGITFRVHHLAWMSMAGEAKRDYPASIGYQSTWYKEYGYVEDHFARVGVAMTRGQAVTRIAVVHPIESFWLGFGPNGSGDDLQRRDQAFADLTNWLLHGLVDFDFISESLLPDQYGGVSDKRLRVGKCRYDVVILPSLRTIRSTTVKILTRFMELGGKVVIAGSNPGLVDAQETQAFTLQALADGSAKVPWTRENVLAAVDRYRELRIVREDLSPADKLLYQMRQDGSDRYVFVCNTDRNNACPAIVEFKGHYVPYVLDTFLGTEQRIAEVTIGGGRSTFHHVFSGCGSLLLRLVPAPEGVDRLRAPARRVIGGRTQRRRSIQLVGVGLSEPNVLVLDYAAYKIDDGPWSAPAEILQADNEIRDSLKIPHKGMAWRQPWTVTSEERAPKANVTLAFRFHSEVDITEPAKLALEDAYGVAISVNGTPVSPARDKGAWWVDEAIKTVALEPGTVRAGSNRITLELPFGVLTNLERVYLLGSFDVRLRSVRPVLRAAETPTPTWGDITQQGLPFYAGNVTYRGRFTLDATEAVTLSVPEFSSPVLSVSVVGSDGEKQKKGNIAIQPRTLDLGELDAGEHEVEITAFGNRYNSFGHFHLPDGAVGGCWPDVWRSQGWGPGTWTDGYSLKPIGVLKCPAIVTEADEEDESGWVIVGP